ncbi:MAG TPA: DUF6089 family protein [Sunxiuqinia sp.]|nr:DUF6089 family protein [Sunxiuqinia sp.]
MRRVFVIILSILSFYSVSAQNNKTADIGIWGGIGSYIGDMNNVDKASSLNPNFGLYIRYNFNSRLSLRTQATLGTIGAKGYFEEYPYDFNKFLTDIALMGEFNFSRYIMGSKKYNSTTYLLGGVGASMFNYEYDPVRLSQMLFYLNPSQRAKVPADVRNSLLIERTDAVIGLNIPVGFGFKFNIGKRLGVGVEAILRKYFNDKIDNLDDPRKFYVTETNQAGDVSGHWKGYNNALLNNDYTLHFGIHLTYRFYQGGKECAVYENIN